MISINPAWEVHAWMINRVAIEIECTVGKSGEGKDILRAVPS